jgi:hypothetical protein
VPGKNHFPGLGRPGCNRFKTYSHFCPLRIEPSQMPESP